MSSMARFAVGFALALSLAGCALTGFERGRILPGQSLAEVIAIAGKPDEQRSLPDGNQALYYVFGPGGAQTWRVILGRDQRVSAVRQVLVAENFRDVLKPGVTTMEEARIQLGRAGLETDYPNIALAVWTYRWREFTTSMRIDLDFDRATGILRRYNTYWDPCPSASLLCMGT